MQNVARVTEMAKDKDGQCWGCFGTKDEKLLLFMAEVDNAKDEQGEGCPASHKSGWASGWVWEWGFSGAPGVKWSLRVDGVYNFAITKQ